MMRLICPNCDAEYEVDANLIPPEGRDVQCANCTHTWLQMPEDFDDTTPQSELSGDDLPQTPPADPFGVEDETVGAPMRPKTDQAALDIIHEEVARETQARVAETGGLETQTEMGLDPVAPSKPRPAEPVPEPEDDPDAAPKGLAPAVKQHERPGDGPKRELLPDIEEINSTLASAPDPVYELDGEDELAQARPRKRSSFRLGFGLMLIVTTVILLLYAYAPELSARFPQFEAQIAQFVAFIDQLRTWLDTAAQSLLEELNALTDRFGN